MRLHWPIEPMALGSVLIVNHGGCQLRHLTPTTYSQAGVDRSTLVRIRTPSEVYPRLSLRLSLGVCYK